MEREKHNCPILGEKLLKWFATDRECESFIGDVEEWYSDLVKKRGIIYARLWYWFQIVKSIWITLLVSIYWRFAMFKSYLKITLRNIQKQRGYSFINITGLAVGMTCFLLMLLYVQYEFSFDGIHEKADRLYRIISKHVGLSLMGKDYSVATPAPLAPALESEFPEVVQAIRIRNFQDALIIVGENRFYENGLYADADFFDMFTFPILQGDKKTALQAPLSMMITPQLVKKYFDGEDPIGKVVNILDRVDVTITGIVKEPPGNSHIQFDFIVSLDVLEVVRGDDNILEDWHVYGWVGTYFELPSDYSYTDVENKLPKLIKKYLSGTRFENIIYEIQPMKRIHLYSDGNFEFSPNNTIKSVLLYAAIGMLVMLIGWINYINLSTARSAKRAKEIGIRKVVGAQKKQLVWQFMGESALFYILALIITNILLFLILPAFNNLVDRSIPNPLFHNLYYGLILLCLIFFSTLFSGAYPALLLSSFRPVTILTNAMNTGRNVYSLRNILVIVQFTISIILIACSIIVSNQLHFIKNTDLGYQRENILVMKLQDSDTRKNYPLLKNALLQNPAITHVSGSLIAQPEIGLIMRTLMEDKNGAMKEEKVWGTTVDYDFLDLYGMKLISGRNFSRDFAADSSKALIINEMAANQMGWEDPIGKMMSLWYVQEGEVIGVVSDFNFHSLHLGIEPLALILGKPEFMKHVSIRISTDDFRGTISFIEKTFKDFSRTHPFEYVFVDDAFNQIYRSEQKLESIFRSFSYLTIFIACLGLFGLASHMTERRTKELGIRKVVGASAHSLILLLGKEFIKWMLIANLIAIPVAYFTMNHWLQNFAYHTTIAIWIFVLSAALAMLIALLTVGYQVFKAATANPVDSLRYE